MQISWPLFGSLLFAHLAVAQNPLAYASNPLMNVDTLTPTTELKAMLLRNLNKHSDGEEALEALGGSKSLGAPKHATATALPFALDLFKPMPSLETTTISASVDELPFNVIQNFFDDDAPISKPAVFGSNSQQKPETPLVGFGNFLRPPSGFSLPTLPPIQALPTLPPLVTFPPLNFLDDLNKQQRSSAGPPAAIPITEAPTRTRQVTSPKFVNQSSAAISPEHVQMWRRRFYKVFKEIKNQFAKNVASDSEENNSLLAFKHDPRVQTIRKPVLEDAMSTAQKVRGNSGPFPIEHSGYAYNTETVRVNGNREAAFSGLGNKLRPAQNKSVLLSEFAPNFRATTVRPVRVHVSNDYEEELASDLAPQVDDDTNFAEEPCQAVGCAGHLWNVHRDDDSRETCNSIRLKSLIESSIVTADAEQSKRIIQTRTEAEFGTFYNVICGAGFFSYIAHTDEFCLASKEDMNCYVFSPVCTDNLGIASGLLQRNRRLLGLRRKALKMNLKRQKKAYINRN